MKTKLKEAFTRETLRPIIYKAFTRFIVALTAALLWDRFVNIGGLRSMKSTAFFFLAALFAAMAWVAWLRLDGIRLPDFMKARPARGHKPRRFSYGDMAEYTDQKPISFDELDDKQRDACCLAANVVCCLLFLVLSLL